MRLKKESQQTLMFAGFLVVVVTGTEYIDIIFPDTFLLPYIHRLRPP
jgi:hypothetical protein